jgi:hypothetical protein
MIFFPTLWAQWLFPSGREHVGCVSDRIFTLATYTHIDFIQDNNDVGRFACLLSLVKHSRCWILLSDGMTAPVLSVLIIVLHIPMNSVYLSM